MKTQSLRVAALASVGVVAGVASAQIYDNGPLITHPTGGFGGAPLSVLQLALDLNIFGFGAQGALTNGIADDFTVPTGQTWNITGFRFYSYQTGSTTTSTFNGLTVAVYNGSPMGGGSIIFGDLTTNVMSATGWSGIYRATDTAPTDNQRPIMTLDSNSTLSLGAGTYWVAAGFFGTLGSGPWAPPVTLLGQTGKPGANGQQRLTGVWGIATDTGISGTGDYRQDFPFQIRGTVVPEPGTMIALGAGLAALLARRRRK
jgi:hypothetical protein